VIPAGLAEGDGSGEPDGDGSGERVGEGLGELPGVGSGLPGSTEGALLAGIEGTGPPSPPEAVHAAPTMATAARSTRMEWR
jgi:hypothetical protein